MTVDNPKPPFSMHKLTGAINSHYVEIWDADGYRIVPDMRVSVAVPFITAVNERAALIACAEALEALLGFYQHSLNAGPVTNPLSEAAACRAGRTALANLKAVREGRG